MPQAGLQSQLPQLIFFPQLLVTLPHLPVQTFDQENLPDDVSDFDALFPKLAGYQDAFREKWGL